MKTATGLTLLAVGAILAFAVRTSPPGLNINIVGWVIMLTGAAGFLLPRRASGWVRSRVLVRNGPAGPASGDTRHPLDDASYPLDDSYPLDGASHLQNGASDPMDGPSYPENDVSFPTDDTSYPQYVLRDPAELAAAILRDAELAGTPDDGAPTAAGLTAVHPNGGWADAEPVPFDELQDRRIRGSRRR
jgi:hypothetical protein